MPISIVHHLLSTKIRMEILLYLLEVERFRVLGYVLLFWALLIEWTPAKIGRIYILFVLGLLIWVVGGNWLWMPRAAGDPHPPFGGGDRTPCHSGSCRFGSRHFDSVNLACQTDSLPFWQTARMTVESVIRPNRPNPLACQTAWHPSPGRFWPPRIGPPIRQGLRRIAPSKPAELRSI